jgi:hypothetical protein
MSEANEVKEVVMPDDDNDIEDDDWVYHVEIIKTYSKDGELVRCVSSVIPGEFEPDETTLKYWAWLDARRGNNGA